MSKITTIGLDLAKNVFYVVCCNEHGKVVRKKMLKRSEVLAYIANLPQCLVGMEACASAHHWARELGTLGHQVKLIPPQYVKPYVRGNKNDYNDASHCGGGNPPGDALCLGENTRATRCSGATSPAGTASSGTYRAVQSATGLLAEYGLIFPEGINVMHRRRLPELLEDGENGLSDLFRRLLAQSYQQLQELDGYIDFYTREMKRQSQQDEACRRLQTIPGYGPIVAGVFHSVVGNGEASRRGRDVSASLGLVPRQHSSGEPRKIS